MRLKRNILPSDAIADYCRRHNISQLSLFGSALRDDFGPESDLDVLIEFSPGHSVGLIRLAQLQRELSELVGGRSVDLRTAEDLSRHFRDSVIAEAEVQYAEN
ncbi:Nucleotidyltransferase domain protein [Phycisphaerae bacterium RAS2]|jgi:uncharacterized protein|nr:Nucleotidyltransferase domain protein [Phycisphaerae bacterium RAS2]